MKDVPSISCWHVQDQQQMGTVPSRKHKQGGASKCMTGISLAKILTASQVPWSVAESPSRSAGNAQQLTWEGLSQGDVVCLSPLHMLLPLQEYCSGW